jgi:hypothetical protein
MFRSKTRSATLTVDTLEERCTPAALTGAIPPPIVPPYVPFLQVDVSLLPALAPVQAAHNISVLVRTDLFGGGHDQSANSATNDLLAIQEPFTSPGSAFDLMPLHKSNAEPTVRAAEAQQITNDGPTMTIETEPIALCVVVEID